VIDPSELDLDEAMLSVLRESRHDEIPDVIRHADFNLAWPELREDLSTRLRNGTYTPRTPRIVEVPKSELATRPMAVLDMTDRILYQALMMDIGTKLDSELPAEVFSARLRHNKRGQAVIRDPRRAWVDFQRAGRDLCDRYEQVCMLTTDMTSYFEYIDIDLLLSDLRMVQGVSPERIDLLARMLHGWNTNSAMNGIPQGPDVSSFLGNFYLRPIDAILRKLDVRFIRFQDDIRVFAHKRHVLREAIHDVIPVVRGRHLNLATGKTKILEGSAVIEHFEDAKKDAIQYRIQISDTSVAVDIRQLFDDAVTGKINTRDVRFSVYRLSNLGDDHAVEWILEHLDDVPYLSELLVDYLSKNSETHPDIETRIVEFLADSERNIDPYVEMQLIRMFANSGEVLEETYDALWAILLNPARDGLSRQFAARAVARHMQPSRSADLVLLTGLFQKSTPDPELRRALLVALKEAGDADAQFLANVGQGDPHLKHVTKYLASDPQVPNP